jgi:Flp pilus assembly protein TadG
MTPKRLTLDTKIGGQSAVELALVLPLITILLLTTTDVARVFYVAIAVNSAARAGVQYGAQNSTTASDLAGMKQAATDDASGISNFTAVASQYCQCPTGGPFSCSQSNNCADKRLYVEVDTSAPFNTLFKYPGLPSSFALNAKAVMREK